MAEPRLAPLVTRFEPAPLNTVPLLKALLPRYSIVPVCTSSVPLLVNANGLVRPNTVVPAEALLVIVPELFSVGAPPIEPSVYWMLASVWTLNWLLFVSTEALFSTRFPLPVQLIVPELLRTPWLMNLAATPDRLSATPDGMFSDPAPPSDSVPPVHDITGM